MNRSIASCASYEPVDRNGFGAWGCHPGEELQMDFGLDAPIGDVLRTILGELYTLEGSL